MHTVLVRSVAILPRADHGAVGVPTAAVVVLATVVAICARCRRADRRRARRARHRTISIAAARDPISSVSPAGNAVTTTMNRSAPVMGGTSVIAATSIAAASVPTSGRVFRGEAGADQNDCCQSSESITTHGFFLLLIWVAHLAPRPNDHHPTAAFDAH